MKKKLIMFIVCVLFILGISVILGHRFMITKDIMSLNEIAGLVLNQGYGSEDIEETLKEISQKRIHAKWGKADGMLSGFWGEIWFLNEQKDGRITLYYDPEGYVEHVIIDTAPGTVPAEGKEKLIYGDQSAYDELGLTKDDIVISAKESILKSPPQLVVTCAKEQIFALQGTYSWEYRNGDGTSTGVEADSMHPLESKEYMDALPIGYSYLSSMDAFLAHLQFEVAPNEVKICYWTTEHWNEPTTKSEELEVQEVEVDSEDGSYTTEYQTRLLEGNYIYEVTARWSGSEEYSGTARYSFYSLMGDYEIIPIE